MPSSKLHRAPDTSQMEIAGSPGYMAPEQVLDGEVSPRTDVFSLGVILFEIVTGEQPFDDKGLGGILARAHQGGSVPPPSTVASAEVPTVLDVLVRSCLRRDPKERVATAREIAQEIETFLDAERAKLEHQKEAEEALADARHAEATFRSLDAAATALREEAEAESAKVQPWDPH